MSHRRETCERIKNMNKIVWKMGLVVALTVAWAGCATLSPEEAAVPPPGAADLAVSVTQDGFLVPVTGHQIRLKRELFTLVITFRPEQRLRVNASHERMVFAPAVDGVPLEQLKCFGIYRSMAEGWCNDEEDLMIDPEAHHSWFFESETRHRFSKVVQRGRYLQTYRKVARLYEPNHEHVSIENLKQDRLYLVIVTDVERQGKIVQTGRHCLELVFD